MSEEDTVLPADNGVEMSPAEPAGPDRVLELDFVPGWARRAPGSLFDERHERRGGHEGSGDRGGRAGHDRSDRRERRPDDRRDQRGPPRDGDRRGGPGGQQGGRGRPAPDRGGPPSGRPRGGDRPYDRRGRPDFAPRLPVDCRFLPDQKALASMIRQIAQLRRAFPLLDLAAIFTSKPETCLLRIDVRAEAKDMLLYQCKACGMVSMDRGRLTGHVTKAHLDDYFTKEEVVGDPPTGQFVCVAKCGFSGTLLGPPNHHSFAAKVQEIHMTRFPHMTMEQYRSRIETVRDPAAVEQWKEESRKRVTYRLKGVENAEPMNWVAAESHMARTIAPSLIQQSRRAAMPVSLCRQMEDRGLLRLAEEAWGRESRFPGNLVFALRGAFRGKHLRVFRARKTEFVTAIEPSPLDPDHVVEPIRAVLVFLREHPGCKREQLVEALRPGKAMDGAEAAEVLSPLGWLVEKGHIIEFFDGSMVAPHDNASRTVKPPAAEPAPAVSDADTVPVDVAPSPVAEADATPAPESPPQA